MRQLLYRKGVESKIQEDQMSLGKIIHEAFLYPALIAVTIVHRKMLQKEVGIMGKFEIEENINLMLRGVTLTKSKVDKSRNRFSKSFFRYTQNHINSNLEILYTEVAKRKLVVKNLGAKIYLVEEV